MGGHLTVRERVGHERTCTALHVTEAAARRMRETLGCPVSVSVGTGATFVALGVPWWLWAAYGAMVTLQIGNRVLRGWSR